MRKLFICFLPTWTNCLHWTHRKMFLQLPPSNVCGSPKLGRVSLCETPNEKKRSTVLVIFCAEALGCAGFLPGLRLVVRQESTWRTDTQSGRVSIISGWPRWGRRDVQVARRWFPLISHIQLPFETALEQHSKRIRCCQSLFQGPQLAFPGRCPSSRGYPRGQCHALRNSAVSSWKTFFTMAVKVSSVAGRDTLIRTMIRFTINQLTADTIIQLCCSAFRRDRSVSVHRSLPRGFFVFCNSAQQLKL